MTITLARNSLRAMSPADASATTLWLLEDREPFDDAPAVGEVFAPATRWIDAHQETIPPEICSDVLARVEAHDTGGRVEWVAHLPGGFATILSGDRHAPGDHVLHGCLLWDRYLWIDVATAPVGDLRLVERAGLIVQRTHLAASRHPGVYTPHQYGPMLFTSASTVTDDYWIHYSALRVHVEPHH